MSKNVAERSKCPGKAITSENPAENNVFLKSNIRQRVCKIARDVDIPSEWVGNISTYMWT